MKESAKYYIQQYLQEEYLHGGVGYAEAERLLNNDGFQPIYFPHQQDTSIKSKFFRLLFLFKTYAKIPKGSTVVFIYPIYARIIHLFINLLIRKREVSLICMVMDIDGLKGGNIQVLRSDIRFFSKLSHFIVLNKNMGEWIRSNNSKAIYSSLNFMSYLTITNEVSNQNSSQLVFAGNLDKSPFLEQLHLLSSSSPKLHFNLYGPGPTAKMIAQKNVSYFGTGKPYDMPTMIAGSFGLIWEGDSINGAEGAIGLYTKYITNHKLSLYILCGLPVIIWEGAGMAVLVVNYKIGYAVKSLYEVADVISNVSATEYALMQENMKPLAYKISQGLFQKEAMDALLNQL